jgi:hypothetical protein
MPFRWNEMDIRADDDGLSVNNSATIYINRPLSIIFMRVVLSDFITQRYQEP